MVDDVAPWLLKARVTPPRQLLSVIERPDLIARLDRAGKGTLIILEAPGGYGKTSLLSAWRDHGAKERAHVCWLSIDEDDDLETFITYLAFAAHEAGIDIRPTGLLNFEFAVDRNPSQIIYHFLASIERFGQPVRIILDDFERLSPAVRDKAIPLLLRRLPNNACLIIASREAVNIDTVNLEHRGLVCTFGPTDLHFTRDEMTKLWHGRITAHQIARLARATEGWPVLARLLLTAFDMGTFDIRHIDDAGYRNMAITTYFQQKILSRLDDDIQRFLYESALFEEVSPQIVSDVLSFEYNDLSERLTALEAFFTPLGEDHTGFRLHPMMREYLKQTFKTRSPHRFKAIQAKAAHWCSARGHHVRAVKHALAAEDDTLLLTILENTGGLGLLLQAGLSKFRAIDHYLSDAICLRSPMSALMRCVILMKRGKQAQAAILFQKALAQHGRHTSGNQHLSISVRTIQLMLAVYGGRKMDDGDILAIERACDTLGDDSEAFRGFVLTCKCVAAHQAGRFKQATGFAHAAIDLFARMGSLYGEVYIHLHLAMIHAFMGPDDKSRIAFSKATKLIQRDLSYDSGIRYLSDILSIEAGHEHDPYALRRSSRLRNIVIGLLGAEGWIDIYAAAFRTLSEQTFIASSITDSLHVLDLAADFAERNEITSLKRICNAQRAILYLATNDKKAAMACFDWAKHFAQYDPFYQLERVSWRVVETECELALYCLAHGLPSIELTHVEALRAFALAEGNKRLATRLSALLGVLPRRPNFLQDMEVIQQACGQNSFGRATLFVSRQLAAQIVKNGHEQALHVVHRHLHKQEDARQSCIGNGSGQSLISDKERAILKELEKGDTDKQIALTLGVTEHAIRYHLKNLYVKFGVRNRGNAIRHAQKTGML